MDDSNVNYKEKYLELMRAAEKAINILIQAQRDCEEKYISESEDSTAESKPDKYPATAHYARRQGVFFVLKF